MPQVADALRAKRASGEEADGGGGPVRGRRRRGAHRAGEPAHRASRTPVWPERCPQVVAFQTTNNFSNLHPGRRRRSRPGSTPPQHGTQIVSCTRPRSEQAPRAAKIDVAGVGDDADQRAAVGPGHDRRRRGPAGERRRRGRRHDRRRPAGPATIFGLPVIVPPSGLVGKLWPSRRPGEPPGPRWRPASPRPRSRRRWRPSSRVPPRPRRSRLRPVRAAPAEGAKAAASCTGRRTGWSTSHGQGGCHAAVHRTDQQRGAAGGRHQRQGPRVAIQTEVNKVMGTPPSGMAALGATRRWPPWSRT